jgi:5-oxoprolinase (ATP-hydrolysing)
MIVRPTPEEAKEHFNGNDWDFGQAFVKQHRYEFGFTLDERDIIIDDVRVRGIGKSFRHKDDTVDKQLKDLKQQKVSNQQKLNSQQVYYEGGRKETPVYKLEDLEVGNSISGPAMLADGTQTIVVTPKATAIILKTHVVINLEKEGSRAE